MNCVSILTMNSRLLILLVLPFLSTHAADWPTVKGSINRSGRSSETLSYPLKLVWSHTSAHVPAPAWPAPANLNNATGQLLENAMTYDRCYHPVIAEGKLYYGSSADDSVCCLNAQNGEFLWRFVTGGPVRLAPVIFGKSLFVGSDDGCLYCLNAETGEALWKYQGGPKTTVRTRMFIGNGRMISRWPIRCGIVVDDETLFFTSGLFPVEGVFLHALSASDGREIWKSRIDVSAQGHMLASKDTLFIPTGRNTPVSSFSRKTGKKVTHFGRTNSWGKSLTGGSNAILLDDQLISGPSEGRQAHLYNVNSPAGQLSSFDAIGIIADAASIYSAVPLMARQGVFQIRSLNRADDMWNAEIRSSVGNFRSKAKKLNKEKKAKSKELEEKKESDQKDIKLIQQLEDSIGLIDSELKNIDEEIKRKEELKKNAWQWEINVKRPHSLLLDAHALYAGFDGYLCAYSISDGSELWKQLIEGRVCGMAISDGSLFVSTDQGGLYCLNKAADKSSAVHSSAKSEQKRVALPRILRESLEKYGLGQRPGLALVVGPVDGSLAHAVVSSTALRVIVASSDPALTGKLRDRFDKAGLYGSRVVVHDVPSSSLPYPLLFADLVMSENAFINGELSSPSSLLYSYVRPDGGVLMQAFPSDKSNQKDLVKWGAALSEKWNVSVSKDWIVGACRRAPLEGAGTWTHEYANPGGTSSSGDSLVNDEMDIQWFGEPGPGGMVDRHFRNVPPLYLNGRLFVPGDNLIYGVNPYNGTVLWKRDVPDSRRTGAFLDAGSMCVDDNSLYVAAGAKCMAMDVETGKDSRVYNLPSEKPVESLQWGLVGQVGESLLGSSCLKGASHSVLTRKANALLWQLGMPVVTCMDVFALDKKSTEKKWVYSGTKILNSSIVFNDEKLYFLEVSGSAAATNAAPRMKISELFAGGKQEIVALSVDTGKEIFRKQINASCFTEPVFLQLAGDSLLLSGSRPEDGALRYSYYVYDAATGEEKWNTSHVAFQKKANDGHGQQNRHPVIIDNTVYAWPYAYTLDKGKKIANWKMDRRGHGCGGVSASDNSLFWRGGNPWMISPESGESAKRLTQVTRPGCWINIIPAGGLIMIPEASSGCTCGYSIQTSLTFGPRAKAVREF